MTAETSGDYLGQALRQALTLLRKSAGSADPAAGYPIAAHYLAWFLGELDAGRKPASKEEVRAAAEKALNDRLHIDRSAVSHMLTVRTRRERLSSDIADDVMAILANNGLFYAKAEARRVAETVVVKAWSAWVKEFHPVPKSGEEEVNY
jgi:hypothetical protein